MLLCVCSTDLFDAFRSHSQMRRGVGPCHTNNTTSQAPSPPTAAQQSTEPSYAACGKTCASNGPPRIIRERPSAPRLCLCHVGAIGCHWETRRGMGLRQATLPRYALQHVQHVPLSLGSVSSAVQASTWPSTPPPIRQTPGLSVCLFSVGGCSWPCSSRRRETSRPVSLSLPPISFLVRLHFLFLHFLPRPGAAGGT